MIDTSAVVAIVFDEPECAAFSRVIDQAAIRLMSAVTRVELTCVVEGRKREAGRAQLERLLAAMGAAVIAVTPHQVELACEAFRRFGKGRHPAALNIGDCFAYALAKATGQPMLFKGADFGRTDVRAVAAPR